MQQLTSRRLYCTDRVRRKDRNVMRFFWLSNQDDPASELMNYCFRALLFGTTCFHFILSATLMKHLRTNPSYKTEMLKHGLYVDNVLSSFQSDEKLCVILQIIKKFIILEKI